MMYQVQIPLGGLPINLVLVGNKFRAAVVFVKVAPLTVIIDRAEGEDSVDAVFAKDEFFLIDSEAEGQFDYNTIYEYKDIPLMLRWLQQQNLQEPENVVFGL